MPQAAPKCESVMTKTKIFTSHFVKTGKVNYHIANFFPSKAVTLSFLWTEGKKEMAFCLTEKTVSKLKHFWEKISDGTENPHM